MLAAWCRWLNTNSEKFKITINNRNRDMDRLEKEEHAGAVSVQDDGAYDAGRRILW